VMLMCWSCHLGPKGWHKNPLDSWEWLRETMGQEFVENLRWLAQTRSHVDKAAERLLLEAQLRKLSEHTAPNPALIRTPAPRQ